MHKRKIIFTTGVTEDSEHWNGGVEAATTLAGAILAFIMGFMHFNWSLIGEITIAVIAGTIWLKPNCLKMLRKMYYQSIL